jgi:hypothetical protein
MLLTLQTETAAAVAVIILAGSPFLKWAQLKLLLSVLVALPRLLQETETQAATAVLVL